VNKSFPALLGLLALVFCPFVHAQDTPKWELYVGAAYANANTSPIVIPAFAFGTVPISNYTIPLHDNGIGWRGQVVRNVNGWFGGVADFSGTYANHDLDLRPFLINGSASERRAGYTFLFGPRVALLPPKDRFSFFVEGLVGGVHRRANAASIQEIDPAAAKLLGLPVNQTSWAYAFGGGSDVAIRGNLSVRLEADWVRSHFPQALNHDVQNNALASVGLVIRIGQD
jgi:hypothetical protein